MPQYHPKSLVLGPIWTASAREQVFCALWAIVGFLAWPHSNWVAVAFFIKATVNAFTAYCFAKIEQGNWRMKIYGP